MIKVIDETNQIKGISYFKSIRGNLRIITKIYENYDIKFIDLYAYFEL